MHEPPTHRVDAEGVWIHFADPAYRKGRVEAEIAEMSRQAAVARHRLEADLERAGPDSEEGRQIKLNLTRLPAVYGAKAHPIARYFGGATRYDLQAELRLPRADGEHEIVKTADYFGPGARQFKLRRLPRSIWVEVESEAMSNIAADVRRVNPSTPADELAMLTAADAVARRRGRERAVLYGLKAADGLDLPRTADDDGRSCLDPSALDMLHDLDPGLVDLLAKAVIFYSQPLREDEFLPSA